MPGNRTHNVTRMPEKSPTQRYWPIVIGLVLLGLSAILAHTYRQPLLSKIYGEREATPVAPPTCDLNQQACPLPIITPIMSEAAWTFDIAPRPIPLNSPLTFTLTPPDQTLPTNRPLAVWLDLTGDDMDMGLIRVPMTQTPDGRWIGTGSIPICVTGQMRWRASLYLQLEQATLQANWVFKAPLDPRHRPNT